MMSLVFTSGLLCLQAGCVEGQHKQEDAQSFVAGVSLLGADRTVPAAPVCDLCPKEGY